MSIKSLKRKKFVSSALSVGIPVVGKKKLSASSYLAELHQNADVPLKVGDVLVVILTADLQDLGQQLVPTTLINQPIKD